MRPRNMCPKLSRQFLAAFVGEYHGAFGWEQSETVYHDSVEERRAPTVIRKMSPKLRTRTMNARPCPARDGGSERERGTPLRCFRLRCRFMVGRRVKGKEESNIQWNPRGIATFLLSAELYSNSICQRPFFSARFKEKRLTPCDDIL